MTDMDNGKDLQEWKTALQPPIGYGKTRLFMAQLRYLLKASHNHSVVIASLDHAATVRKINAYLGDIPGLSVEPCGPYGVRVSLKGKDNG